MKMFICTVIILVGIGLNRARAEWAENETANVVLNYSNATITVKANGTAVMEEERQFTSRNEAGRNKLALESLPYSPELTSIQVLKASSITDGIKTPVDIKTIHHRAAAGSENGITGLKELVIPFTNLQIGSSIQYKFLSKEKKALFPGMYFSGFSYGHHFPELGGEVLIRSEKKLNFVSTDKNKYLEITEGKEKNYFTLKIKMLKPFTKEIKEENIPILRPDSYPMVFVTTMQNWPEFVNLVAPKYEKILNQPLPSSYQAIVSKAEKVSDTFQKIDTVTSMLSSVMTYSGNWTTLDRMFYPRNLSDVAKLKTGDCKDFATSTAAMLRKLGFKATVGLVKRRIPYDPMSRVKSRPIQEDFAMPIFNHAIVRVETADKKVYWVDPTNVVSNSKTPGLDIAESAALNLSQGVSGLEYVPASKMDDHLLTINKKLKVTPEEKVESEGTLQASGLFSTQILEVAFMKNEKTANEVVLSLFGSVAKDGVRANYKSRMAGSFTANIETLSEPLFSHVEGKNYLIVPLPRMIEYYTLAYSRNRASDFFGSPKAIVMSKALVEGYDFDENNETGCWAASPWFEIERKLLKVENGFVVQDEVRLKSDFITANEINDEEFSNSLNDLQGCGQSQRIQISKLVPERTLPLRLKNYTTDYMKSLLDVTGPKLMSNSAIVKVIADQILEREPKNIDALIQKARATKWLAYRSGQDHGPTYIENSNKWLDEILTKDENHAEALIYKSYNLSYVKKKDEAKKMFSKAYYASKNKGYDIYRLGAYLSYVNDDYKMASQSYLKALEFAKTNAEKAHAWTYLARIAQSQNEYSKAEDYFSRAAVVDKENPWLMNDILILTNMTKNFDRAIELGESLLKDGNGVGVLKINLADAYSQKAKQSLKEGSLASVEKARDTALRGLKWSPNCYECHVTLARSYEKLAELKSDPTLTGRALESWKSAMTTAGDRKEYTEALAWQMVLNAKMSSKRTPSSTVPSTVPPNK